MDNIESLTDDVNYEQTTNTGGGSTVADMNSCGDSDKNVSNQTVEQQIPLSECTTLQAPNKDKQGSCDVTASVTDATSNLDVLGLLAQQLLESNSDSMRERIGTQAVQVHSKSTSEQSDSPNGTSSTAIDDSMKETLVEHGSIQQTQEVESDSKAVHSNETNEQDFMSNLERYISEIDQPSDTRIGEEIAPENTPNIVNEKDATVNKESGVECHDAMETDTLTQSPVEGQVEVQQDSSVFNRGELDSEIPALGQDGAQTSSSGNIEGESMTSAVSNAELSTHEDAQAEMSTHTEMEHETTSSDVQSDLLTQDNTSTAASTRDEADTEMLTSEQEDATMSTQSRIEREITTQERRSTEIEACGETSVTGADTLSHVLEENKITDKTEPEVLPQNKSEAEVSTHDKIKATASKDEAEDLAQTEESNEQTNSSSSNVEMLDEKEQPKVLNQSDAKAGVDADQGEIDGDEMESDDDSDGDLNANGCPCAYCTDPSGKVVRDKNGMPLHICHFSDCDKTFTDTHSLQAHTLRHMGEKPFKCEALGCDKEFVTKSLLKSHVLNVHSGDGKHQCLSCEKTFKQLHLLNRHVKQHHNKQNMSTKKSVGKKETETPVRHKEVETSEPIEPYVSPDEKHFECDGCGKRFLRKSNVVKHMRTTCPVYKEYLPSDSSGRKEKVGEASADLEPESEDDDSNSLYECSVCAVRCKDRSSLDNHMEHEHNAIPRVYNPLECRACGRVFTRLSLLAIHTRTVHDDNVPERPIYTAQIKKRIAEKAKEKSVVNNNESKQKSVVVKHAKIGEKEEEVDKREKRDRATELSGGGGEHDFKCLLCAMTFKSSDQLAVHAKAHAYYKDEGTEKQTSPANKRKSIAKDSQAPAAKKRAVKETDSDYVVDTEDLVTSTSSDITSDEEESFTDKEPRKKANFHDAPPAKRYKVEDSDADLYSEEESEEVDSDADTAIAYACPWCDRTFPSTRLVPIHIKRSHGSWDTGDQPKAYLPGNAVRDAEMNPDDWDVHPCTRCDKVFSRINYLQIHLRDHIESSPVKYAYDYQSAGDAGKNDQSEQVACKLCGKVVTRRGLKRHMNNHKKTRCPHCDKEIQNGNLNRHLKNECVEMDAHRVEYHGASSDSGHEQRENLNGSDSEWADDFESRDVSAGDDSGTETGGGRDGSSLPVCKKTFHKDKHKLPRKSSHLKFNRRVSSNWLGKPEDRLFGCSLCPAKFSQEHHLSRHMQAHESSIHGGVRQTKSNDADHETSGVQDSSQISSLDEPGSHGSVQEPTGMQDIPSSSADQPVVDSEERFSYTDAADLHDTAPAELDDSNKEASAQESTPMDESEEIERANAVVDLPPSTAQSTDAIDETAQSSFVMDLPVVTSQSAAVVQEGELMHSAQADDVMDVDLPQNAQAADAMVDESAENEQVTDVIAHAPAENVQAGDVMGDTSLENAEAYNVTESVQPEEINSGISMRPAEPTQNDYVTNVSAEAVQEGAEKMLMELRDDVMPLDAQSLDKGDGHEAAQDA